MSDYNHQISDKQKVDIASNFILHSPPGEFNEVFNDVRNLLNNDTLLKEGASSAFVQYNKDQLTPVHVPGVDHAVLITNHNDLGRSRFFDPESKQSFVFDHLKKEVSGIKSYRSPVSSEIEAYRQALQQEITAYTSNHFKHGNCAVYAAAAAAAQASFELIACIEDHQFEPKNYWNGRWRSVWTVSVSSGGSGACELRGVMRLQVHYYEDGNVQLVSSKHVKLPLVASSEEQLAVEAVQLIESSENDYQTAICENYQTMSDTTFKALRRQLPVTRSKIDWGKIVQYTIGRELKQQ